MKRKVCFILLTVVIACFALFGLSACDSTGDGQLQMNKKYISSGYELNDADKQVYYIFYSDGTGEYRYYFFYQANTNYNEDYTVKFRYTYADDDKTAVVCFFDSVTYGSEHTDDEVSTKWASLLTVSKNVLCSAGTYGYSFYINEDYLENIPNFGK